jgi:hypothetical protein
MKKILKQLLYKRKHGNEINGKIINFKAYIRKALA